MSGKMEHFLTCTWSDQISSGMRQQCGFPTVKVSSEPPLTLHMIY